MHVPLADAAKCLDFSLVQIYSCQWSWGWCFWGSKMKPRSYVQVTENAFECAPQQRLRLLLSL